MSTKLQITLWAIGILVAISVPLVRYWLTRRGKLKALYRLMWKTSKYLQPEEVMGMRGQKELGFDWYFFDRPQVREIQQKIAAGEHTLILGDPLAGKTRTVLQALRGMNKCCHVTIPNVVDLKLEDFRIPFRFLEVRRGILFLDDLQKFTEKQNFEFLLKSFVDKGFTILATCRSGSELDQVKSKLEQYVGTLFQNIVEIGKITEKEKDKIIQDCGAEPRDSFDGNIGSLFLPLDTMREYYRRSSNEEKAVLRSIKRLFLAGVYEGRETFSTERIAVVCREIEGFEFKPDDYVGKGLMRRIVGNGFVKQLKDAVQAEEAYLDKVVETDFTLLENFRSTLDIFADDAEALFGIGNRANDTMCSGAIPADSRDIKRLAVTAYKAALSQMLPDRQTHGYAMTQFSLGTAYKTLAGVENPAENYRSATQAFTEALKVYTRADFSIHYAITQNNLGGVHQTLAGVENPAENCRSAIQAFTEALQVFTLADNRWAYAMTQLSLGVAYQTLAVVENPAENCRSAIQAFTKALKVFTLADNRREYAVTQLSLGAAYQTLAGVENKAQNYRSAIQAFTKALTVYTLADFRREYAVTQLSLGAAYQTLAGVENPAENCRSAIQAYTEALTVYTRADFPMDYARTQNNLGNAYLTLAGVENKTENCKKAEAAYDMALKVAREKGLAEWADGTENNLRLLAQFRQDSSD